MAPRDLHVKAGSKRSSVLNDGIGIIVLMKYAQSSGLSEVSVYMRDEPLVAPESARCGGTDGTIAGPYTLDGRVFGRGVGFQIFQLIDLR